AAAAAVGVGGTLKHVARRWEPVSRRRHAQKTGIRSGARLPGAAGGTTPKASRFAAAPYSPPHLFAVGHPDVLHLRGAPQEFAPLAAARPPVARTAAPDRLEVAGRGGLHHLCLARAEIPQRGHFVVLGKRLCEARRIAGDDGDDAG